MKRIGLKKAYMKNKRRIVAVLFGIALVMACVAMIVDWGAEHKLQKPIMVLFKVETQPLVTKREPEIIIKPLAENQPPEESNLDGVEKKIYDAFGVQNYRVMRAVAVCESGLDPEAVNWNTRDIGLYQINWPVWEDDIREEFGYILSDMFDVDKNIEVAKWIWDRNGDGNGSVIPWVATNTSCFREEL